MWIPSETKDPVLLHPTRRSFGYFGAVRLRNGRLVYRRDTGRFNAVTCFDFLRQLQAVASHSGKRVVVNTDDVQYNHAVLPLMRTCLVLLCHKMLTQAGIV